MLRQTSRTRLSLRRPSPTCFCGLSTIHHSRGPIELASLVAQPTSDASTNPGPSLVILHGLFGSKRNWTSLHKAFHRALPQFSIHTLDLRNHGTSPHATPMTNIAMAEDVLHYIDSRGLTNVALLGHSMGGKAAMTLALLLASKGRENLLSHLLISDIAPTRTVLLPEFVRYIDAMLEVNALPLGTVRTRTDVDRLLHKHEPDLSIRQFLMTNLILPAPLQSHTRPHFHLPLDVLKQAVPELGWFPYDLNDPKRPQWNGKTLIFRGLKSPYIDETNEDSFKQFFPDSTIESLDTGHWVHVEKPNEFKDLVIKFVQQ
ncbi:hypothetical protein NP233_g3992 [Leucocoprinus birnbaumii]|uniref:AB hydrolase-1 domain-containing protein n=1 Tax=Leucocoprinus birnbaumii TaxID=56174 RepID=A0AAD5VY35_9AGAR|nr:hypothetical protein NP233_g3992 [Leucocoprinus birnbaumii]